MRICVAGKNKIAIQTVKNILDLGVSKENLFAIYNQNENGINSWQPSFKWYCQKENISEISLSDAQSLDNLIFISTEFDKIIKTEKFKSKELFNIHFSALPAYKGMYTSVLPILYGEESSGVTLHKIDDGIDTGEIIDQSIFKIGIDTTARELYDLYLEHGIALIKKNLLSLFNKSYSSHLQTEYRSTYFSKKTIDFQNIEIDINKTAWEISNQIHAFSFRPYQLPFLLGSKVTHARILDEKSTKKAGSILSENEDIIKITSIDYNLLIFKDKLKEILKHAELGNISAIESMKKIGFNIFEKNLKGWDALIVAAYQNQFSTCKWLIENGANVNTINNNGTSALMYAMTGASRSNDIKTLELLINSGADTHHKDYSGKALIEYALDLGSKPVIKCIEKYIS